MPGARHPRHSRAESVASDHAVSGTPIPAYRDLRLCRTVLAFAPTHKKTHPREIVEMGLVYVAEERHLFPQMTVLDNLKLGAYNTNARAKERETLEYVFQLFPRLAEFKNRYAATLSGGEARMLTLGRGIMSCAKLLAIDEPSFGLAPILRNEVFDKINEINSNGMTVLLVEQNVNQVVDFADRICLIEDGCIVFDGPREEALLNEHVKNVFLGG